MDPQAIESVRLGVYDGVRQPGRAPSHAGLAAAARISPFDVPEALAALHASRDIVLRDGVIAMAHPFTAVPLGFSVMGERTLWWGGCAWDSFAIPHLIPEEPRVLVATTCPACGAALAWRGGTAAPPEGPEGAHFLVPTQHIWDDVVHSCGRQRLYCSEDCVATWLQRRNE